MRRSTRPLLESLESRHLLSSTFYVTPLSTPSDATHFHSLAAAYNAASPGTSITILAGSVPETAAIPLAKLNLVIQGDPNVSPLALPRYNLTLAASDITISHMALDSLTIASGAGFGIVRNSDILSLTITGNTATGNGFNTFDSNTIHGAVAVTGNTSGPSNDTFTHNTIVTTAITAVSVLNDNGFTFTDNKLTGDTSAGFGLHLTGELTGITISRNTISLAHNTDIYLNSALASGVISNNVLSTANAGIAIHALVAAPNSLAFRVEGNDFTANAEALYYEGDAGNPISFDLGGGSQSSLGANNFRTFTSHSAFSAIVTTNVTSNATLFAQNNIFTSGSTGSDVVTAQQGTIKTSALTPVQALIANLYNSLLQRTPKTADYTYWSSVYTAKGQAAVVTGIQKSTEALDIVVNNAYLQYLNRPADSAGESYWVSQIQAAGGGMTETTLDAGLLSSTEFIAGAHADYIQSLYQTILNRTAASTDISYWYTQLPSLGLKGIATALLNSAESRTRIITNLFQSNLHRTPTSSDLTYFLSLNADPLTLQSKILATTEYLTKG